MGTKKKRSINVARPDIGKEELAEVEAVFKTGWLGMGDRVFKFENALKSMFKRKYAVCVNTGTSGMHLAADSLGLSKNDEVIVPSLTFVATPQAIIACGGKPVFCDVELDDLNISIRHMKSLITKKTRAVMPVHYGGSPCQMDEILRIARERGVTVIEDAAHAFGSQYAGRLVGSFGDLTCFSFDPIKNMTCGEGGAILTDDDRLADIIIKKRILGIDKDTWNRYKHKRSWFYEVHTMGYRYHMSNINAAIGLAQLKKFCAFKKIRRAICKLYDRELAGVKNVKFLVRDYDNIVPFNYTILVPRRDELMAFLQKKGIGTVINYIPNHLQPLFAGVKVKLPNTDAAYKRMVSIPVHAAMTVDDARFVAGAIKEFYRA